MTSINPFYTFQYDQPKEYHFSHDSVFLARDVFEIIESKGLIVKHALDLCSGCGVVGLDFLFHLKNSLRMENKLPEQMDFIEVQTVYKDFFHSNNQRLELPVNRKYLNLNYADVFHHVELKNKYDLIICNPPYFRPTQGTLSTSEFKNRCRFFIDSDFKTLIDAIDYLLKPRGQAYVLIQDLADHGIFIEEELKSFTKNLDLKTIEKIKKIRQTDLYLIKK